MIRTPGLRLSEGRGSVQMAVGPAWRVRVSAGPRPAAGRSVTSSTVTQLKLAADTAWQTRAR